MRRLLFIIIGLSAIAGCDGSRKLSKPELLTYINDKDNNLRKVQLVNGINIQLIYRPSSLLVMQEIEGADTVNADRIKILEDKYSDHYYFILKLSKEKKEVIRQLGSFSSYSSMLQVLAFDMQNYINLTAGKDTVPVADYYFDQTYGMSDGNNVLLSFNKSNLKGKKTLFIHLGECGFGTGNVKFCFDKNDLDDVPVLDYSFVN